VTEADLLIHVVDISHPEYQDHIRVVKETLEELGASDTLTLMAFNKLDRLEDRSLLPVLSAQHPHSVFLSAMRGINILGLKEALLTMVRKGFADIVVKIPPVEQSAISRCFDLGEVLEQRYDDTAAVITIRIPVHAEHQVRQLVEKAGGTVTRATAPE